MLLSDTSVKRPVFATVISLLLMLFGLISYQRLPVREYPDVDPPIVSIETTYTGAAAAVIDTRITTIIEDRISGIEGIRSIESRSRDGESEIVVEFDINRDVDDAANDLRDRVSRIQDNLPDEADPPEISKVDADARAIMWFNMSSDTLDRMALSDYADRYIVDRLSAVDGVARVRISAEAVPSMRIWLDRKLLAARRLTVEDVENALIRQNVELPGGRIESKDSYFTIRLERPYRTAAEFNNLVITRSQDGYLVRMGDVARVEVAARNEKSEYRGDGKPMIGLGIIRTSGSNTLDVAHGVRTEIARIKETLPAQFSLTPSYDSTVFIEAAMHEVWVTFAIAAGCVILVIFLFLRNVRATLIPMVAVPVSILGAFTVMYAMGFSINLLTLLALVLAIGIVVDDAIVVLENIYRRMELGETPLVASYRGARQVGFAVVATTAVLMAVFIPIVFLSGMSGRVFTELAVAMAASIGFSGLVALTLSPMLCSKLLHAPKRKNESAAEPAHEADGPAQRYYGGLLKVVVANRSLSVIMVIAITALTGIVFSSIPQEFTPAEDRGAFFINVKAPEGIGFEHMQKQMRGIEADLMKFIENGEAIRVIARTPGSYGDTEIFNDGRGIVVLSPWDKRERSGQEIVEDVREMMQRHPGVRAVPFMRSGLSRRGDQPVQFVIGGSEYADLAKARDHIFKRAREFPGLANLDADYEETKPQLLVNLDTTRASELGLSTQVIGRTLETLMGSRQVTTYIDRGEEYDVMLQAQDDDRVQPSDLTNIFVRSSTSGELIPLSNVISLKEVADAGLLPRYNKLRSITISASVTEGYTLGQALQFLENVVYSELPQVASVDYKGDSLEFKESSQSMLFILGLALVIVFLVLAAQFESFIHPFVIIFTVPLALFGAALAVYFTGNTLNIFTQLGVLMLIGIAAKNGILIVEFANQLRDEGMEIQEALIRACKDRLRPILMTSIATAAGAVPLVLGHGAGAETRAIIGLVILAGITSATIFTLFIIPALYSLLAPYTRSPNAVERQLEQETDAFNAARRPAE